MEYFKKEVGNVTESVIPSDIVDLQREKKDKLKFQIVQKANESVIPSGIVDLQKEMKDILRFQIEHQEKEYAKKTRK